MRINIQPTPYSDPGKSPTLVALDVGLYGGCTGRRQAGNGARSRDLAGGAEGAIRKRVDRGTLEHDKGDDGRVYVYLPDGVHDGQDASTTHESNALISEMRSRIDFLEEELRRKDAILLNMTEAMKALNPPQGSPPEPRESAVTASDDEAK